MVLIPLSFRCRKVYKMGRRVFLIVLDSMGIGAMPDAIHYGDEGSHTLRSVSASPEFAMPNMARLGLFDIEGTKELYPKDDKSFQGTIARLEEKSKGKDTTTGHWEMMGVILESAMPVFEMGIPKEFLRNIENVIGRNVLCGLPFSGTKVIEEYGQEMIDTNGLIIYTSADSVIQIAAHVDSIPLEELYEICEKVRELAVGKYAVGRVIARPFAGVEGAFYRTEGRHDYSLKTPHPTVLDRLKSAGLEVIGVGKIADIFAGEGITQSFPTKNNQEGLAKLRDLVEVSFEGLCFVNLVDFDMLFGHRNDVDGYARALSEFDKAIMPIVEALRADDILMVTADHGCDPATESTDHSREYVPLVMVGNNIASDYNMGTIKGFDYIGKYVEDYLLKEKMLKMVDHTLLAPDATSSEIFNLCEEAIAFQTASVCIPPLFVKEVKETYKDALTICTVIGFPNGYMTKEVKVFETKKALQDGADEIDMVIPIGYLKEKRYDLIEEEIKALKAICKDSDAILKVIIETCLLTEEEKIKMCEIVTNAKADYIKTSTGFSRGGATLEDIELFKKHVGAEVKIKAAGGIASFEDAYAFVKAGASRLGTSRLIKLMKQETTTEY